MRSEHSRVGGHTHYAARWRFLPCALAASIAGAASAAWTPMSLCEILSMISALSAPNSGVSLTLVGTWPRMSVGKLVHHVRTWMQTNVTQLF